MARQWPAWVSLFTVLGSSVVQHVQMAEVVEVRMGGAIALSGKHTSTALSCIQGWQLWAERCNSRGGIPLTDGRVAMIKQPFDLRDDESEGSVSVQVLEEMLNESSPAFANLDFVIGPFSSGISKVNSEVARDAGKILFAHGASESIYETGNEYVFTTMTPGKKYMGSGLELLKLQGASTVVIAHESSAFPRSVCQGANETAHELGFEVVGYFEYQSGSTNFADIVFEIRALSADVYVGCGHIDDVTYLVGSANILNVNPKAMLVTVASDERIINNLGVQYSHGLLSPTQWDHGLLFSDDDGFFGTAMNFSDAYLERFGQRPPYHSAFSAAMGYALQKAIEEAGVLDTEVIRDTLHSIHVNSFYGPIDFSPPGDPSGLVGTMPRRPMVTTQVQYGEIPVVAPSEAANGQAIYPLPTWAQKELMLYPCVEGEFDTGQQDANGSAVCEPCQPGEFRDKTTVACTPCSSGRFAEQEGSSECIPCAPATQAELISGSASCVECPAGGFCSGGTAESSPCLAGHYCEAGSAEPTPCPAGTYAANPGGADIDACIPCPVGYFGNKAGASGCEPCQRGWRNDLEGERSCTRCPFNTYQDLEGQSECMQCNTTFYTAYLGAATPSACQCLPGTFMDKRSVTCMPCIEGLSCPGGERTPFVLEGYYAEVVGDPEQAVGHAEAFTGLNVWLCPRPSDIICPGREVVAGSAETQQVFHGVRLPGECPDKHNGLACARCESGYWLYYGSCHACGPGHTVMLFLAFLSLSMIAGMLLYRLGQPSATRAFIAPRLLHCAGSVVLTFLQLFVILTSLDFEYHSELWRTAVIMRPLLLDNIPGFTLDCWLTPSMASAYLLKLVVLTYLIILLFALWSMSMLLHYGTLKRCPHLDFDRTCNIVGGCCQTLYLAICKIAIGYFECKEAVTGAATLVEYPTVVCWSDEHRRLLPLGILAVLVYILGILAACVVLLVATPRVYKTSRTFRSRIKFLLVQWRPDKWYWSTVLLFRNLIIGLLVVLFRGDVLSQAMAMLILVGSSLVGQAAHWPWCDAYFNWLDMFVTASTCTIITLCTKYIAGVSTGSSISRATFGTVNQLIVAGVIACFVALILYFLMLYGKREALERQHYKSLVHLARRYIALSVNLADLDPQLMVTALNQYPSVDLRQIERGMQLLGAGQQAGGIRQPSASTQSKRSLWKRKTRASNSSVCTTNTSTTTPSSQPRRLQSGTLHALDFVFRATESSAFSDVTSESAAKMDAALALEAASTTRRSSQWRSNRTSNATTARTTSNLAAPSNLSTASVLTLRLEGIPHPQKQQSASNIQERGGTTSMIVDKHAEYTHI
mmetsp:Transcript_42858/g.98287  ORF Transcript_42858/g.98287 Transcript_42858/m.98287 type:complete len:1326 (+) Transcript_42858:54-4031(+)